MSESNGATTLAVLHDEGDIGHQWCQFIQKMFTEELPEEYRDMNLDLITDTINYVGEDDICNINNCEYTLLLLNSEVLKLLKNPESSLRGSELMETNPDQIIILILGQEDDVAFLQEANMCIFGFGCHDSYHVIQAKYPDQIFRDIMSVMAPMYVVPHPNILSTEDKEQHLTLISNKPFSGSSEVDYIVEFSTKKNTVESSASLFNSSTLLVQNPGHAPGIATVRIYACVRAEDGMPDISRNQIGGDMKVWFQSDLDKVYSILESQSDPMQFLCQAMNVPDQRNNMKRTTQEKIDKVLTDSFKKSIPPHKLAVVFGNSQHFGDQDGNRSEYMPTLLHFAALYGLRDLTASLLQCPGAVEAYGTANCDGDYPTNLAEKSGHWDLRDFMQTYMEVAAMVHDDIGSSNSMQTSAVVSDIAQGHYIDLAGNLMPHDEIYEKMRSDEPIPISVPGYLSMKPNVSEISESVDYDCMLRKMFDPEESEYEIVNTPAFSPNYPSPYPPRPPSTIMTEETPPLPPPRDGPTPHPRDVSSYGSNSSGMFGFDDKEESCNLELLLPKLPSDLPTAQQELIALQQKVKNGELTINQAVFRFKEWERKHKERQASFQYQQENLQRIRNSLMRSREERKMRGESTSIKISQPIIAGTSTYDKVLLKTRRAVMDATYGGLSGGNQSRSSFERDKDGFGSASNTYTPEKPFSMRASFQKSSFGRPPVPIPGGRTSISSQSSTKSSASSCSFSSNDSYRRIQMPLPNAFSPKKDPGRSPNLYNDGSPGPITSPPPVPPRDDGMKKIPLMTDPSAPFVPPRCPTRP